MLEQAAASVCRCLRVHCPNPDGRTDEGRVKTRVRHIKEIDGKIDTLVIKFCLIHWVPLFRLHHKKFAAEDPLEPQTVQDRRVGIFALNVIAPVLRNTCLLIDPRQRSTVPPSRHINVSSVAEDEQQVPRHLDVPCHSLCLELDLGRVRADES